MKTEEEIAMKILQITEKMIELKEKGTESEVNLFLGCLYGLLISINRSEGFLGAENQLAFINEVIFDILTPPEPLDSYEKVAKELNKNAFDFA
jgi:hypothetical protein